MDSIAPESPLASIQAQSSQAGDPATQPGQNAGIACRGSDPSTLEYHRRAVESIDRWMLAISSAALGFGVTLAKPASPAPGLKVALTAFAASILFAMCAKGLAYLQASTELLRESFPEVPTRSVERRRQEVVLWRRKNNRINAANVVAFIAFLVGLGAFWFAAVSGSLSAPVPVVSSSADMPESMRRGPVGVAWMHSGDAQNLKSALYVRCNSDGVSLVGVVLHTNTNFPAIPDGPEVSTTKSEADYTALLKQYDKSWSREWHMLSWPDAKPLLGRYRLGERLVLPINFDTLTTSMVGMGDQPPSEQHSVKFHPPAVIDVLRELGKSVRIVEVRTLSGTQVSSSLFYADEIGEFAPP